MEHLKQIGPECYLVTTAMLTGRPLETIRAEADTIIRLLSGKRRVKYQWVFHGRGYADRRCRTDIWFQFAKVFEKRYGMPRRDPRDYVVCGGYYPTTFLDRGYRIEKGAGTISIRFGRKAHIAPYQDGLVYDSQGITPLPFEEWIRSLIKAGIKDISSLVIEPREQQGSFFSE
jgi:hypothetical protein